ncbi:MAG: metallophosphoesterase [Candidatus Promineofilum sp.]|nr:metallophosphoesterase [Promineifilum sp.]
MTHSFDTLAEDDVLTRSRFHFLLKAFYAPAGWPTWLVGLAGAGLAAAVGALWWLPAREALLAVAVGGVLLAFFAADALLLQELPRRRVSFGPWQGQIAALALPRTAVAIGLGLAGFWLGWPTALLLLIAAQLAGLLVLYRAALGEPSRLGLSHLTISSERLPPGAPPIRILHVGDIHLERLSVREAQLLELVKATEPDLILLTGDYVNLSNNVDPETHAQVRRLLGQLHAHYGIFAVLGTPPVDLHAVIPPLFDGLPARLLRDEAVAVTLSRGRCLTLLGLDCHHDIARDTATLDRVLAAAPDAGPRVLLYHSPELMLAAAKRGIDLYLCGHTHGGQVRLPLIGPLLTASQLGRRFVMGHYTLGRTHLYVTRGIGFEGLAAPRVRLLCPPEVTLVEVSGKQ